MRKHWKTNLFIACLIFAIVFTPYTCLGNHLYLLPSLKTTGSADTILELIQCSLEKGALELEIIEGRESSYPLLKLSEGPNDILLELFLSPATLAAKTTFSASTPATSICEWLMNSWEASQKIQHLPANMASTKDNLSSETSPQNTSKNFFQKNWPYLALAALAGGTILILSSKHSTESPTMKNYESRGFIVKTSTR